jgi:hypothetical protein
MAIKHDQLPESKFRDRYYRMDLVLNGVDTLLVWYEGTKEAIQLTGDQRHLAWHVLARYDASTEFGQFFLSTLWNHTTGRLGTPETPHGATRDPTPPPVRPLTEQIDENEFLRDAEPEKPTTSHLRIGDTPIAAVTNAEITSGNSPATWFGEPQAAPDPEMYDICVPRGRSKPKGDKPKAKPHWSAPIEEIKAYDDSRKAEHPSAFQEDTEDQ